LVYFRTVWEKRGRAANAPAMRGRKNKLQSENLAQYHVLFKEGGGEI